MTERETITEGRLRALEQMRMCHANIGCRDSFTDYWRQQLEYWRRSLDFWNRRMMMEKT